MYNYKEKNGKLYNQEGDYAVLLNKSYGLEWNRQGQDEEGDLVMHCPELVLAVEKLNDAENPKEEKELRVLAEKVLKKYFPNRELPNGLSVEWVPDRYYAVLSSYDGYENVKYVSKISED